MLDYNTIEWERMAKPQDDGYDTEIYKQIVKEKYGWVPVDPPTNSITWLDGKVEIRALDMIPNSNYTLMDPADERFKFAAQLAETWPAQYEQFRQLINYTSGYESKRHARPACGSCCGPHREGSNPFFPTDIITADEWGNVWSALLSGTGFIEGTVHELAHWKAYALDIFIEDWGHTIFTREPPPRDEIDNAPSPKNISPDVLEDAISRGLTRSPLRADKMRPLGASYQACTAAIHMLQYHFTIIPMVKNGFSNEPQFEAYLDWVRRHYTLTMVGYEDLLRIVELSEWGEKYWQGYVVWVEQLKIEAKNILGI